MEKLKLGDWCKWFEKNFSPEVMIPELPVIIRLDGNNFHNWTKGLKRPFDENLTQLMIETTTELVKFTNAIVGYCQSDEITLVLYSDNTHKKIFNDGKKQKMISKITAHCVNTFNEKRKVILPNHDRTAIFDCRIYQTPTLEWAVKQLLWRELDATKNSISVLAQSMFSHKSLMGLTGNEMQKKMLEEKNVNWNDLEVRYKRGTYVGRKKVTKTITKEELALLPEKHNARKAGEDMIVTRTIIEKLDMPIMSKISNKVDVIFNNIEPIMYAETSDTETEKTILPYIYSLVKITGDYIVDYRPTEKSYINEIATIICSIDDNTYQLRTQDNNEISLNKKNVKFISAGKLIEISGKNFTFVKTNRPDKDTYSNITHCLIDDEKNEVVILDKLFNRRISTN